MMGVVDCEGWFQNVQQIRLSVLCDVVVDDPLAPWPFELFSNLACKTSSDKVSCNQTGKYDSSLTQVSSEACRAIDIGTPQRCNACCRESCKPAQDAWRLWSKCSFIGLWEAMIKCTELSKTVESKLVC